MLWSVFGMYVISLVLEWGAWNEQAATVFTFESKGWSHPCLPYPLFYPLECIAGCSQVVVDVVMIQVRGYIGRFTK